MQEEIIIQNLWWKTKSVSESKLGRLKRAEFSNLLEELEVKYSNEIGKRDLKGLVKFCEEFDTKGIVVTKDILKEDENILFVPAWLFLLIAS